MPELEDLIAKLTSEDFQLVLHQTERATVFTLAFGQFQCSSLLYMVHLGVYTLYLEISGVIEYS